jgi:hypothetical protein
MMLANTSSKYKPTCFSGHSPPLHMEKIRKFLKAHARLMAPKKTLSLFDQILDTKKQMIMAVAKKPWLLIWLPKLKSALDLPLIPVK